MSRTNEGLRQSGIIDDKEKASGIKEFLAKTIKAIASEFLISSHSAQKLASTLTFGVNR